MRTVSPALAEQDCLLAPHPHCAYIIVMPSGSTQNVGVQLMDPIGRIMFKLFREKAPSTPTAVYHLYEWLAKEHPHLRKIILKQLTAEYGVDPLACKRFKMPNIYKNEISQAMMSKIS